MSNKKFKFIEKNGSVRAFASILFLLGNNRIEMSTKRNISDGMNIYFYVTDIGHLAQVHISLAHSSFILRSLFVCSLIHSFSSPSEQRTSHHLLLQFVFCFSFISFFFSNHYCRFLFHLNLFPFRFYWTKN